MSTSAHRFDRIVSDPAILAGAARIRGTRISVRRVLEILAVNPSWDDLRADYPALEAEDIRQALGFAAVQMVEEVVPLAS